MKKFKDIADFEQLLKDNLQGHSVPAPADAWSSIASATGSSASVGILGKAASYLSSTANILKVALFAGGLVTAGVVVYNTNQPNNTSIATISSSENQKSDGPTVDLSDTVSLIPESETSAENIVHTSDESHTLSTSNTKSTTQNSGKPNVTSKPTSPTVKSTEKPMVVNPPKNITPNPDKVNVDVDNAKPCLGETASYTSNKMGDWYVNDMLKAKQSNSLNIKCTQSGLFNIKFVYNKQEIVKPLVVSSYHGSIQFDKNDAQEYSFELNNADHIANWYIDGILMATNAKTYKCLLEQVGKHTIKAVILNHTCSDNLELDIDVKPIGSITIYEVFTKDDTEDGFNDEYSVDIEGYDNFSIQIFDQEYRRVFFSQDPEYKWNGSINNDGPECPSGEYFAKISYKLKGEAPALKNQKITLIRP